MRVSILSCQEKTGSRKLSWATIRSIHLLTKKLLHSLRFWLGAVESPFDVTLTDLFLKGGRGCCRPSGPIFFPGPVNFVARPYGSMAIGPFGCTTPRPCTAIPACTRLNSLHQHDNCSCLLFHSFSNSVELSKCYGGCFSDIRCDICRI